MNGTAANYTYDDASRLTQLQHVKGATIIAQFDYNMDVVSRRTNRVEQLTSGGAVTDTYKYDGTDQVTNVLYAGATTVTYGYDPLGNLTNTQAGCYFLGLISRTKTFRNQSVLPWFCNSMGPVPGSGLPRSK